MTLRFGLPETTIHKIYRVFARYPQIEKAARYGSRAKETYKNGSDIDLTLHGRHLTLDTLYEIMIAVDDLLLPYTIDLSIYHTLTDPDFLDHIHRVGLTFYEKGSLIPEPA